MLRFGFKFKFGGVPSFTYVYLQGLAIRKGFGLFRHKILFLSLILVDTEPEIRPALALKLAPGAHSGRVQVASSSLSSSSSSRSRSRSRDPKSVIISNFQF